MEIITTLRSLIGEAPASLSWLEYVFAFAVVCISIAILFGFIKMLFKKFNL